MALLKILLASFVSMSLNQSSEEQFFKKPDCFLFSSKHCEKFRVEEVACEVEKPNPFYNKQMIKETSQKIEYIRKIHLCDKPCCYQEVTVYCIQ